MLSLLLPAFLTISASAEDCNGKQPEVTPTLLIEQSYVCFGAVLGKAGEEKMNEVMMKMGALYGVKNGGLWLTKAALEEMGEYCKGYANPGQCESDISVITTADVNYASSASWKAMNGIQAIHDQYNVCPMWLAQHKQAVRTSLDIDCGEINAVESDRMNPADDCMMMNKPKVTPTLLIDESYICFGAVLGKAGAKFNEVYGAMGQLYGVKNGGLFLTKSDRAEMAAYCDTVEDSDQCHKDIEVITTSKINYATTASWKAMRSIQEIHDNYDVCPYWLEQHKEAVASALDGGCDKIGADEGPREDPAKDCKRFNEGDDDIEVSVGKLKGGELLKKFKKVVEQEDCHTLCLVIENATQWEYRSSSGLCLCKSGAEMKTKTVNYVGSFDN